MESISVILIDNYDSFTYNVYQLLRARGADVQVFRNDQVALDDIAEHEADAIVISPGPKSPGEAGASNEIIARFAGLCSILGVCLGHQCINEVFGGRTVRAPKPWHGKTSAIRHDGRGLFQNVPQPLSVARYHSLVADPACVGSDLQVSAWTEEGVVMGLRHRTLDIEGVQFHPESFLTEYGALMIDNFLRRARGRARAADGSTAA